MCIFRFVLLASTCLVAGATVASAADLDVAPGATVNQNGTVNVSGTNHVTVGSGGTLNFTAGNPGIAWNGLSSGVTITNSGNMNAFAGGRLIRGTGAVNGARNITVTNNAGALMRSDDDTFQINVNIGDPGVSPAGTGNILISNAGTILSNTGQALDFDAIAAGTASVAINNTAGGILQSKGQDAIRPGQGAIVTNSGMICGGDIVGGACQGGMLGNSFDGVDWQGKSGTVLNKTGATISSVRHGITSDVNVNVTNESGATIVGRNGSGVGSDGDGAVTNHGIITGAYDGVSANGDGDGVDIDHNAVIVNFGIIQGTGAAGVDSGGDPNGSEGIAIGRGSIANNSGALISGATQGILVDDGAGGAADGATSITNAGTIRGLAGSAIKLVGNFADTVANSGLISGVGASAVDLGAGDDKLNLAAGSVINGKSDGGDGFDTIDIAGNVMLGDVVNFEKLILESGAELELATDLAIDELIGAIIVGDGITNIIGNGHNFYYNIFDEANAYLQGRNYFLEDAGQLIAAPEPWTFGLLAPGLLYLLWARRGRRPSLNSRRRSGLCM